MYLPTLLYLMSSTSKKQRKFQSSVPVNFNPLPSRTYYKTASNQTRTTKIMINNSLPNPFLRKSIPRKCYLLGGSCVCVCVCDIMGVRKEKEGGEGKEEEKEKKKKEKERTKKKKRKRKRKPFNGREEKRREETETCSISIDHFVKNLFCFCRYSV